MRQIKNSGIEWIGEIPVDWELIKIGSIFRCRNEKVNDTDYPPLSVTKNGIVPQMENVAKTDANDNRKMVKVNDFVINSRSDRKQSCGVSELEGSVSLINTVLFTENADVILPEYTNLIMKNYGFAEEFYRWGHGIVADLWTTRWQEMKSIVLPLPSTHQQKKIVEVMRKKISSIDSLIAHEEVAIEELKAYKQSVITETVTKGFDKSVPMKDSGVEWVGEIPESWSVNRIKFIATYNDETLSDKTDLDFEISYVDIGSVSLENGIEKIEKYSFGTAPSRARRIVRQGDVIISTVRTYLKAITRIDRDGLIVSTGFCVLRPIKMVDKFVEYFCKSNVFTNNVASHSVGISYPAINATELVAFYICQPNEQEQQKIAAYLDKKCADIDSLISIKQQKIEELKEYKKSLIYEYVTGKKEVA